MEIGYSNSEIKRLKKLKNKVNNSFIVVEGLNVLQRVIKNNFKIDSLFYCEECLSEEAQKILNDCKTLSINEYIISAKTFERIREKENETPIIAIVVGNERFGINSSWYKNAHHKIFIPMNEGINSINVGAATSIILFEASIKRKLIK